MDHILEKSQTLEDTLERKCEGVRDCAEAISHIGRYHFFFATEFEIEIS